MELCGYYLDIPLKSKNSCHYCSVVIRSQYALQIASSVLNIDACAPV